MSPSTVRARLRGAVLIDQMQPQFAATVAANSDGYFPVGGESAFWVEVEPGIVVTSLLDLALKACEVTPGALITERSYGTLEVHGSDQGQVRRAGEVILGALDDDTGMAPQVLTHEVIRKVHSHQAMLINRSRSGMLVLGDDTLYTLEVTPAVYALAAANEAEKTSPIRLVGLENNGAVGRVRLAGGDAEIDQAVEAVSRTLDATCDALGGRGG